MKKIICLFVVSTLTIGLYGCGTKETIAEETSTQKQVEVSLEKETTEEVVAPVNENMEVHFGSYVFTVSNKYNLDTFDADNLNYKMNDGLLLNFSYIDKACKDEEFELCKVIFTQTLGEENGEIEAENCLFAENEGIIIVVKSTGTYSAAVLINDKTADKLLLAAVDCKNTSLYSYVDDFRNMIKTDLVTKSSNNISEENNNATSGITPELKEFLTSYESFIDEYVSFKKKYTSNPGDALALLSEYTDILSKYENFSKKIDQYDSDDMSTEDAMYYLEVVNRCNQKMLEIY